ncbi:class I SAM-dependent methyltransferase [Sunxiuqinia dokdonensis]|uniref:Methyltransferase n=1 Tax=Sunxiuqinia dokdonensis TaxID=1409788 RepID=A0A0L8V327_9BACT|nr:class I SAM-dependent methyltransferase [Sunxiuqinia dokdonensis]KOH42758.1 methyltransferase [Sunxiuqinia dokdonensis]
MMSEFWNERFAADEYVYGTEPNAFFRQELKKLTPGKILLPGEGEGRNAVFAAQSHWQVTAFDSSVEGRKKAEQLAARQQVQLNYQIDSYDSIDLEAETFDCLALIYTHMPPGSRQAYHRKLSTFLKVGGTVILEGFSKAQIHNNTGGPGNVDMLFSTEELQADFAGFASIDITETDVELSEGPFHQGTAQVIRLVAVK